MQLVKGKFNAVENATSDLKGKRYQLSLSPEPSSPGALVEAIVTLTSSVLL